jgi:hypothetical protein
MSPGREFIGFAHVDQLGTLMLQQMRRRDIHLVCCVGSLTADESFEQTVISSCRDFRPE